MNFKERTYEVDNRTNVNHEGQYANTPVRRLTSTSIVGDKVQNYEGQDLGTIENLMININDGHIEYAVIEFGSVLGMGGKLFAVPFTALTLDPTRQLFMLNKDKEYLKECPGFDKNHWPDTNDHSYYTDVNTYWEAQNRSIYI